MIKNISYINSWNFFSKSIFIKENIIFSENKNLKKTLLINEENKNSEKTLLITETNKEFENYEKIFNFLNLTFRKIDNYSILKDYLNINWFYITSIENIENIGLSKNQFEYFSLILKKDNNHNLEEISKKLIDLWYKFSEYENSWSFNKKGDILKIISSDSKIKYEISFWWDNIEEIRINWEIVKEVIFWKNEIIELNQNLNELWLANFLEIINKDDFIILDNLNFSRFYDTLTTQLNHTSAFDYIPNKDFKIIDLEISTPKISDTNELKEILIESPIIPFKKGIIEKSIIIYTKNPKVIKNFIEYNNVKNIKIIETKLNNLKSFKSKKILVICDDILWRIFTRKRLKKNLSADLDLLLKIKPWDYVVHIEHWIWIFKEIIKKEIPGKKWNIIKEYIEIEYGWKDKLFVPITEASRVNKYLWMENPKLTWLWWVLWENKIKKAKEEAVEIAQELIEIYANRKLKKGFSFIPNIKKEEDFRDSFSYTHTIDQDSTIKELLSDMEEENPMDRLIVWDVGFGKTEIAFNAIYRSYLNKKQSILIVPLVVLAYEHYEKAKERFKQFWLNIWVLTRLETEKKASETIKKLSSWELDLVIWTHKLLSDKIIYKDLWLIITDEEHKFGVADKEKIKEFKATIDSLAMSATPIPRSLNMALSNLRQISILKTAPFWRQDIETTINRFSDNIIELAWNLEFARWWQMFFVHNRVASIENIAKVLKNIFPKKKIIITHWQLAWTELEKRIIAFKNKQYDILLSTTVIENWIDFSNVNTIIINNAEQFWLSQIHQLRWRVWRSDRKWYCHLLYKWENIKPDTAKRLKIIVEHSYVWAWFELAMKDLEIRWGWDLLGFRQSGQSSSIWINLYLKIIEEKIIELQENKVKQVEWIKKWIISTGFKNNIETKIDLDIDIFIPDDFFWSQLDKINFYREIESINNLDELVEIKKDFIEINTNIPESTNNLFDLLELKLISKNFLITNIKKIGVNYQIDFDEKITLEKLKEFLDLDKQVYFIVNSKNRLRSPIKNFANNKIFLIYILSLLKWKKFNPKIKIKKK